MKVVLREDVVNLGTEGQVVDVADGYARNYLVPKKLAEKVTPGVLKDLEYRKKAIAKKEEKRIELAKEEAKKFDGKNVKIVVQVNEDGKLYGSITVGDVVKAIEDNLKESVDKNQVIIADHIKETGTFPVTIRIHPQVEAKINLEVTGGEAESGEGSEQ